MASKAQSGALVGQRLGKYDILALLAVGGTAEIYLARIAGEAGFEKYLVVKVLLEHLAEDDEFVRMFLDEARLGAQLEHSNIVQMLELGQHDGRYFMVMEYLAGLSLAQLARRAHERVPGRLLPPEIVLGLAAQACAGLHYAHERTAPDGTPLNVVHRDISPQNLVISFEGMLKLVDFGIAKAEKRETKTRSGTIKGKFAYMSPEQCQAKDIDRRTDIFALGTIIHELLTGRRLFKRSTTYETYQAIVGGKVPPPSSVNHELDPSLDEVVMKALSFEREDRYGTAEEFGQALLATLHKRGKSISASDVARLFDSYFKQELEDHIVRMRELVSGGTTTIIEDLTWDASEIDSDFQEPPVDPPTVDEAHPSMDAPAFPGEATKIELNPLEKIKAIHDAHTSTEIDSRMIHDDSGPGLTAATRPVRGLAATLDMHEGTGSTSGIEDPPTVDERAGRDLESLLGASPELSSPVLSSSPRPTASGKQAGSMDEPLETVPARPAVRAPIVGESAGEADEDPDTVDKKAPAKPGTSGKMPVSVPTPTPFRARIPFLPKSGMFLGSDAQRLAIEAQYDKDVPPPFWLLAVVFAVCFIVGLTIVLVV